METIYAPVNIEEIQVQEQPDNHNCEVADCSKEAVYKIKAKRSLCTCADTPPFLSCIPHKDIIYFLHCAICKKPMDIISITYIRR